MHIDDEFFNQFKIKQKLKLKFFRNTENDPNYMKKSFNVVLL